MKALILAAGRGKRLNKITDSRNKCMLEVNGIPLIEHNLNRVIDCKEYIDEILIVIGYRAQDIVDRYYFSYRGIPIRYVVQDNQKGLVHAIECSRNALNGKDFFLLLGDEYLVNSRHKEMIEYFKSNNITGVCGILRREQSRLSEISKTYNVLMKDNNSINKVLRLIEKPMKPLNNIQGTGHCIFKNEILDYIRYTPTHYLRNEKELPDLIQCVVDDDKVIMGFDICEEYMNVNDIKDLQNIKQLE